MYWNRSRINSSWSKTHLISSFCGLLDLCNKFLLLQVPTPDVITKCMDLWLHASYTIWTFFSSPKMTMYGCISQNPADNLSINKVQGRACQDVQNVLRVHSSTSNCNDPISRSIPEKKNHSYTMSLVSKPSESLVLRYCLSCLLINLRHSRENIPQLKHNKGKYSEKSQVHWKSGSLKGRQNV